MNELIDKWFYGTDYPVAYDTSGTMTSYTYEKIGRHAVRLHRAIRSTADMDQGLLGDCYVISSLAAIGQSNPQAIKNMFLDNGDGTWTVRFFYNGKADYVTVDQVPAGRHGVSYLPVDFQGNPINVLARFTWTTCGPIRLPPANVLWIPLLEKAYAQWNEVGTRGTAWGSTASTATRPSKAAGRTGLLADPWDYGPLRGHLVRRPDVRFDVSPASKDWVIAALKANEAVTMGTSELRDPDPNTNLYGGHAYMVSSYDPGTDTFTL